MRVLVVGNGAREHAIAKALNDSGGELYGFMNAVNPGISRICRDYTVGDILNPGKVFEYSRKKGVELAVIGPEAPLGAGVADALEDAGILCVGPRKSPARLETDKSFARPLMQKYNIRGCPAFGVFDNKEDACSYIDDFGGDLAIKPAGLTGGKGVAIMGEHFDLDGAKKYVCEIFDTNMGKIPKVVLEERLVGEEFTLQGFVDGKTVVGAPMVQDHKRAYDGDVGPNTGGMGSYTDKGYILPFLTQKDYDDGLAIMRDTIEAVEKETGERYRGFLYGQFMATKDGVKVIEYNARLGDPEAMNILSILESSMVDVCEKIGAGSLGENDVSFKNNATVCKYLVPHGYPTNPLKNLEINVDEAKIKSAGAIPYYAAVREESGKILTSSSRAVAVVGVSDTIEAAEKIAEECMNYVDGNLIHRKDIGTKELIKKRIDHMRQIRG
ncbi:MAG: phosphoribosylamine--glycine ligase [Candidatus Altiarchaeota archaeon]|nr:phosphoribosylamine--glycine ligase [Candidatus Altiarchaeota archaeon]